MEPVELKLPTPAIERMLPGVEVERPTLPLLAIVKTWVVEPVVEVVEATTKSEVEAVLAKEPPTERRAKGELELMPTSVFWAKKRVEVPTTTLPLALL